MVSTDHGQWSTPSARAHGGALRHPWRLSPTLMPELVDEVLAELAKGQRKLALESVSEVEHRLGAGPAESAAGGPFRLTVEGRIMLAANSAEGPASDDLTLFGAMS